MNSLAKKLSRASAIALCVAGLGLSSMQSAQAFWGGWSPWNWFGGRHWDYYNPYWGGGPYGWGGGPYNYYQPWGYSPYYGGGGYYPPYYGGGYYPYSGYYSYSYAPPAAAPAPAPSSTKKD